jgi:hypothetical protein
MSDLMKIHSLVADIVCANSGQTELEMAGQVDACSQLFSMNVPGTLSAGNSSYFHLCHFLFLSLPSSNPLSPSPFSSHMQFSHSYRHYSCCCYDNGDYIYYDR